jgi:L,D-transpeptidase ErfK/SrfK
MVVERKVVRPTWHVPASILKVHQKKGDPLPATVPPGPKNPLGEYALYLNKTNYVIHGTNKPSSIGLKATNGCIRLYPEDIKRLYEDTQIKTPVHIVNQPYLIGERDGIVYIEIHATLNHMGAVELKKIYAKLNTIEKKTGRKLNWKKIHETLAEARGIPVPVSEMRQGSDRGNSKTVEVKHPGELYGRPRIPKLTTDGWYVLAGEVSDETQASRLAAVINHQGPPIPARVLPKGERYRVIAGPFNNSGEAKDAARRLKVDLQIEGLLIEPARQR